MNELIEQRFELITAITKLDISTYPDQDPFNGAEAWKLVGQNSNLDDLLDETERSVAIYDTPQSTYISSIVRSSNYHIDDSDIICPHANLVLLGGGDFSDSFQWDAYFLNGIWNGEWSSVSSDRAQSLLEAAQMEIAG